MSRNLLVLFAILFFSPVQAAVHCVSNATEFQQALDAAEATSEADDIRLRPGTYVAPAGGFIYLNGSTEETELRISGGWYDFFGTACGIRLDLDAFSTTLSGSNSSRVLRIRLDQATDLTVQGLTFVAGNTVSESLAQGARLKVESFVGWTRNVNILGNAFIGNTADDFGGAISASAGGFLIINNNLFVANQACHNGGLTLTYSSSKTAYILNNTVLYNGIRDGCPPFSGIRSGGLRIGGTGNIVLLNNLLWGNENIDLHLDSSGIKLIANNYETLLGTPGTGSGVNFHIEPVFRNQGFFDYQLDNHSALIDLGVMPTQNSTWQLLTHDIQGLPRVIGERVDIGAYENQDHIFMDGFES